MGNEPSSPTSPTEYRVLYRIELTPGEIVFDNIDSTLPRIDTSIEEEGSSPKELSVEIVVACEHGEVGPIPVSQLQSHQQRVIESWNVDVGRPKYCIVVVYRTPSRRTPSWNIEQCIVVAKRKEETTCMRYQHLERFVSGSGVVYSITMSPYETEVEVKHNTVQTFTRHTERPKDNHQA